MSDERPPLTTSSGAPVPDNQNSLIAGARGPLLVIDHPLIEKHAQFNRERIPERVVHAKGSGAFGTLTITADISALTKARVFAAIGTRTDVLVRFSTVAGERGSADAERDVRGFAIKLYTEDGNWDLVGNNTPVFFVRDPYKFPDFIHSQKRDPRTNLRNPTAMWDFWSRSPESLHQVTILMSDRGLPASYRHMHGFGTHAYSLVDHAGARTWVKFHLVTQQGVVGLADDAAAKLIGIDRESHQRDLYQAIEELRFPRWTLAIQLMSEREAELATFDPFDTTKVWPHREHPLREVGVLELDRNPENYFVDVEQASFSPANLVPGIGLSPDPMLQLRALSYPDAARHRLGTNFAALPVNLPRRRVNNYYRDGAMRFDANGGGSVNYEPSSFGGPVEQPSAREPAIALSGAADRHDRRAESDDYAQAGALFRLMDAARRAQLLRTIAAAMRDVPDAIVTRQLGLFSAADPDYARGVATALGLDPREGAPTRGRSNGAR